MGHGAHGRMQRGNVWEAPVEEVQHSAAAAAPQEPREPTMGSNTGTDRGGHAMVDMLGLQERLDG